MICKRRPEFWLFMRDWSRRKAHKSAAIKTSTKAKLPIIRNSSALPKPGAMGCSFLVV